MPSADRHDDSPVSVRFQSPELKELKNRLDAHIKLTGQSRSAFILKAIREKLDRETPAS